MELLNGGLILEGGAMRGVYTAGVLDYFMERDTYFKTCIGVSAGANNATNYVSKQKNRAMNIILKYLNTKQYASATAFLITGNFYDKKFHTKDVPKYLVPYDYKAAAKSEMDFYAVVTECESGEAVYKKITNMKRDTEWLWASGSMPLATKMVEIDGKHYMDGAIADSIPVAYSVSLGNTKNVAVLTRDSHYRKKQSKNIAVMRMKYHKYPEFVKKLQERPDNYNHTLDYIQEEEQAGRLFVIRPQKPVTIGHIEKDRDSLLALYNQGYEDAKRCYDDMLAYFDMNGNRLFLSKEKDN